MQTGCEGKSRKKKWCENFTLPYFSHPFSWRVGSHAGWIN